MRRKFVDAPAKNPKATRVALKLIARLYRLERAWDETETGPRDQADRSRLRQRQFARTLAWLHALERTLRERYRPRSLLGEVCGYLLSRWAPLTRHVDHGQTRLDNNLVENPIRPSAIGN